MNTQLTISNLAKTIFIAVAVAIAILAVLEIEQPQVVVKDGMVVEVDGKPTYRKIGKWDKLEANIIYK